MKTLKFLPIALALAMLPAVTPVSAQTASMADPAAPMTRERVKQDRDEFMRSHQYDTLSDTWTLKPGFDSPAGMKTRAEVKAERDMFMKTHRYNAQSATWTSTGPTPRTTGLTRAEVQADTKAFMRTHRWDDLGNSWIEVKAGKN